MVQSNEFDLVQRNFIPNKITTTTSFQLYTVIQKKHKISQL